MRKASETLVSFLKKAEGCKLVAYQDAKGVWTIGYGHTNGVKRGDYISQQMAVEYLREDLASAEAVANSTRRVDTQGKFDAVVDFVYNCGPGNFKNSTLKRYIEAGRATWEIQEQFLKWVSSGGKKLGGLVSRRIWEAARWAE